MKKFLCNTDGGNAMKNMWDTLNRRQFIESTSLTFFGLLSFIISDTPERANAQSEKDTPAMSKYICEICGYIYDPEKGDPSEGIQAGTPFEKLPDSWRCPICGADKTMFKKVS
jgi:rubredoxin